MSTPQDFVLPYDKYQGKTLAEVLSCDRPYVEWLAKSMTPRTETGREIKAMAAAVLAAAGNGAAKPGAKSANGSPARLPASPPAANGRPAAAARSGSAGSQPPRPKAMPEEPSPKAASEGPRIYSEITKSNILHLEDALAIGKVRVFLLAYQRGQGASATVSHFLDVEDARVLAADLAGGRLPEKFTDYKGSPHGPSGKAVSRVLKVEDRGDEQRAPIVLQVANGPGLVIGEGAIKPDGKPDAEIAILLTRWQARRLGCALQTYLLAWQVRRFASPPPSPQTRVPAE